MAGAISVAIGEHVPLLRHGICCIVSGTLGFELAGFTDNSEGLLQLVSYLTPDVAVVDFELPGFRGQTLLRRLKERCPATSILIISGRESSISMGECFQSGAKGYILRSVSVGQLLHAIHAVYAGEAVADVSVIQDLSRTPGSKMATPTVCNKLDMRELQTLQLAAKGLSNKSIAKQLSMSEHTIHSRFSSMFRKMGVASRTEATYHAFVNGWINLD